MEDRFSAAVDLQGEPTQVIKKKTLFFFREFQHNWDNCVCLGHGFSEKFQAFEVMNDCDRLLHVNFMATFGTLLQLIYAELGGKFSHLTSYHGYKWKKP